MPWPELRFIEDGHRYYLEYEDGSVEFIPSVSEIIKPLEDYSMVDPLAMHRAAEFGTNVHKAIELYLKGLLDEEKLDEGLRKPLNGFKAWFVPLLSGEAWGEVGLPEDFASEEKHYHKKLKYAGTIDLIIRADSIIDFKTRKYNPVVDPVRLAAYKAMLPDFPPLSTNVLEIDVEGNCKLVNAHHKSAWGAFRKLLDFYNKKKEMENFIAKWKGK